MAEVRIESDVVFGTGGGRELRCDVYHPPATEAPAPGVLLLHGGGWRQGSRAMMNGYGGRLAAAGVPVELHLYAEQPHGFAARPEFIDLCCAEVVHFLGRYLVAAEREGVAQAATV